jgi:hypothetical protein
MQKRTASSIASPIDPFTIQETPILRGITLGAFWISSAIA